MQKFSRYLWFFFYYFALLLYNFLCYMRFLKWIKKKKMPQTIMSSTFVSFMQIWYNLFIHKMHTKLRVWEILYNFISFNRQLCSRAIRIYFVPYMRYAVLCWTAHAYEICMMNVTNCTLYANSIQNSHCTCWISILCFSFLSLIFTFQTFSSHELFDNIFNIFLLSNA